ncbi:competence protein ComEC [Oleiagrimonas sp. C23AA]|uniref:ComEC/Rec2 family competence protein n=1 Tax=Oleiagrimonas sp. C23AA TaxID=2719047 RepID=UPI0014206315|nr:competence protein ComEC [Oleiagrimonas sp. C23AA]NII09463.1 competence protein ComEC [Oleiagrimonas sp. C23AA]
MEDFFEIDFLGVETAKSGDAITIRYRKQGEEWIHVVDGGYIDTGEQVVAHIEKYYRGATYIDHVVLSHSDGDHANGLRKVLEHFTVGALWMNRPWLYVDTLITRFKTYNSTDALERALRRAYPTLDALEKIALEKDISIREPFQGAVVGKFTVLAPSKEKYLKLVVDSDKTPEPTTEARLTGAMASAGQYVKALVARIRAAWGEEYFPPGGTSEENEQSVVQYACLNGKKILLTGDAGREALSEAIQYAPSIGLALPGLNYVQVPHHGGRHNVSTEILDKLLGPRLPAIPEKTIFSAVCSSAKADEDHPRDVVKRAFMHRGAHWAATEGRDLNFSVGIEREGWSPVPQAEYPTEMEQ